MSRSKLQHLPKKHLLDDGKSLYKTADKVKLQEYTLRKVLQQVRREHGGDTTTAKGA